MATAFLSTANTFLPSSSTSSSSSSSSSSSPSSSSSSSSSLAAIHIYPHRHNVKRQLILSKAVSEARPSSPIITKRTLSITLFTSFVFSIAGKGYYSDANAAILEADDDEELLEKVKKDRKKRIEKQGVISSSNKETGYLQELVYKLSQVGQAIDNNDLSAAGSVLGSTTDTDWVQKANVAFTKLSSSPEEKTEVDAFNSSLSTLISSVIRNDVESSKIAFVSSATAFEKWTSLTGLVGQLKGL